MTRDHRAFYAFWLQTKGSLSYGHFGALLLFVWKSHSFVDSGLFQPTIEVLGAWYSISVGVPNLAVRIEN
jgi:hypothetical protein